MAIFQGEELVDVQTPDGRTLKLPRSLVPASMLPQQAPAQAIGAAPGVPNAAPQGFTDETAYNAGPPMPESVTGGALPTEDVQQLPNVQPAPPQDYNLGTVDTKKLEGQRKQQVAQQAKAAKAQAAYASSPQGQQAQASGQVQGALGEEKQAQAQAADVDAAASDLMAVGAMRALRANGRKVPDDVAIVGFDDSHASRLTDPQLTTVRQPMEEIGRSLARLLLTQLRNPGKRPASLIVPTELVIRDSS